MDKDALEGVLQELPQIFPLMEGKIMRAGLKAVEREKGIAPHHLMILKLVRDAGPLPLSEIGGWHDIPKPQMTYLIERLVELGLVERQPDDKDRRVINVALTQKGRQTLEECMDLIKESARKRLSSLSDEDLRQLAAALKWVREIISRVE
jgi:DNA-binding MarR family transcriptional regulator